MSSQYRDLQTAALYLRNVSPDGYENFLSKFNDLVLEAMKTMTEAPTDTVLVQQGRAQERRALLRALVECDRAKTDEPTPQ